MRKNQRADNALRPVRVQPGFQPHAYSSLLMAMGETEVACAVTLEEAVPPFLKESGKGWITAEYGMLPCSTHSRMEREAGRGRSGRTYEIQRLIGRALRVVLDLSLLGEITLRVDCDVLKADGGTRTASITGAALALREAVRRLVREGRLTRMPQIVPVAAVSVGLVNGRPLLDLDYGEDSSAEVDGNFVMTADGRLVEVQTTAEGRPFTPAEFAGLTALAQKGIAELLGLWQEGA